jgi:DNA gyrase/topoisomerase IV subunit B
MKYDASSIKVLDDPVAFIRQRPEMFVGLAQGQPEFLATSLEWSSMQ